MDLSSIGDPPVQLFFMDLASDGARWRLAQEQLDIHRVKLSAYVAD
jgi:hypothetical protein